MRWGGIAGLVSAGRSLAGAFLTVGMSGKPIDRATAWMIGASIPSIIVATGGFRLLRGGGRGSGSFAVLVLLLDLVLIGAHAGSVAALVEIVVRG